MKNILKKIPALIFIFTGLLAPAQKAKPQSEDDYFQIRTISIPENIKLEVGGLAVLPDGRLGVSTRRGEIWIVENPYSSAPHFIRFASGMHEVLGLAYKDGSFYCTQRGELTKITDIDHDDKADLYEAVYKFDLSGNYHEYAYGPVFDKNGDMFVTLNVAWIGYGEGLAKWHGWLLKIKPNGGVEPIATGLRSPAGFNINSSGDVFYAENQGDWVGSGRVTHLEKGDFAGNAGGLKWTKEPDSPIKLTRQDLEAVDNGQPMHEAAKVIKQLKLPAVWFPHTLMGISTSDIIEDTTSQGYGPFSGQYFVADQGHSKIMRMTLEKINGKYQGACYPFREGFASGLIRMRWGLDGSIFAGMTSRGWSSTGKELYALQRLVWTGKTPFEMKNIHAMPDGFEIEFTTPINKKTGMMAENYELNSFTYKYHHIYGSPVINKQICNLKGIIVSEDGRKVRLVIDGAREGYIHEIKLDNITDQNNNSLLHNFAYYTLNNIPSGEKADLSKNPMTQHVHHSVPVNNNHTKVNLNTKGLTVKRQLTMPDNWGQPDQIITLGTKPVLQFSVKELKVKANSKIKLVFNNNDNDMTHNFVLILPNTANEVGNLALNMGLEGSEQSYVPNSPKILYNTNLLQPNSTEVIYFIAPAEPGNYTYLCTYPGHAAIMQGIMKVVK